MTVSLVRFACSPGDEPKFYLLDEEKFDDYVRAEPPEGYAAFETVWHGDIAAVLTRLNNFADLCQHG